GADVCVLCVAALYLRAHSRSPRPGAQLARPRRRPQGAAHPRLRHDGAVGGHRLVHSRARPQGAPAPGAHPAMIQVLQVDAFTERPFAGNPAAVVLDADGLSDAQMQSIASEMCVAAPPSLVPPGRPDCQWRLRWFTPTREIAYSGHTTLGAVHALLEAGRLHDD